MKAETASGIADINMKTIRHVQIKSCWERLVWTWQGNKHHLRPPDFGLKPYLGAWGLQSPVQCRQYKLMQSPDVHLQRSSSGRCCRWGSLPHGSSNLNSLVAASVMIQYLPDACQLTRQQHWEDSVCATPGIWHTRHAPCIEGDHSSIRPWCNRTSCLREDVWREGWWSNVNRNFRIKAKEVSVLRSIDVDSLWCEIDLWRRMRISHVDIWISIPVSDWSPASQTDYLYAGSLSAESSKFVFSTGFKSQDHMRSKQIMAE